MATGGKRGSKPVTARDWLFGSRPRRLALCFVLTQAPPTRGWTKSQIADAAEVSANGGVDEHVRGLVAIGLLKQHGRRYLPAATDDDGLAEHLIDVIRDLEHVPEVRVDAIVPADS